MPAPVEVFEDPRGFASTAHQYLPPNLELPIANSTQSYRAMQVSLRRERETCVPYWFRKSCWLGSCTKVVARIISEPIERRFVLLAAISVAILSATFAAHTTPALAVEPPLICQLMSVAPFWA